jgi:hypothetical protein
MEKFFALLFTGEKCIKSYLKPLKTYRFFRYRPDLVDWGLIQDYSAEESNELAFRIFEKEFNIPRIMSSEESLTLENTDIKNWLHYLEMICEVFRGEIPHVKHLKLDYAEFKAQKNQNAKPTMADFAKLHRIAAAKREQAKKDENGASHVSSGGRRSQKLAIAEKVPSELKFEKLKIEKSLGSNPKVKMFAEGLFNFLFHFPFLFSVTIASKCRASSWT